MTIELLRRNSEFRNFSIASIFTQSGRWIYTFALIKLAGTNPLLLALIPVSNHLPLALFGLWGGRIADKYERRKILLITQTALTALFLAGSLVLFVRPGAIWVLLGINVLATLILSVDKCCQNAFICDMVGKKAGSCALSFNNATFNACRVAGPAVAAFLLTLPHGAALCYLANTLLFTGIIWIIANSDLPKCERAEQPAIADGIAQVRNSHSLWLSFLHCAIVLGLGYAAWTFAPALCAAVGGLSIAWVLCAYAGGSFIGFLLVPATGEPSQYASRSGWSALFSAANLFVLAASSEQWVVLFSQFVTGLLLSYCNGCAMAIISKQVRTQFLGRVNSILLALLYAAIPLGAFASAMLMHRSGIRFTLAAAGAAIALATVAYKVALQYFEVDKRFLKLSILQQSN